jgi:4-diphosphocytidyl-2-C-methyl-D-erythritol kinase
MASTSDRGWSRRAEPVLTEHASAKLNLALHLRRRRGDGYHELETIFAFTAFGDTLRAEAAGGLTLRVTGPFAGAAGQGGDNLVLRAARALAEASGTTAGAALTLDKVIPVAAGLGGGSADAAATLRLLNRLWDLHWPESRLVAIAATLGADVAACVVSRTVFGSGRGESLAPIGADWSGTPVLLVNPRVAVPTGPVFGAWDRVDLGPLDPALPLTELRNDLAPPALTLAPVIGEVLDWLGSIPGVSLARMSGSGATCFALFNTPVACAAAAQDVRAGWWAEATGLI